MAENDFSNIILSETVRVEKGIDYLKKLIDGGEEINADSLKTITERLIGIQKNSQHREVEEERQRKTLQRNEALRRTENEIKNILDSQTDEDENGSSDRSFEMPEEIAAAARRGTSAEKSDEEEELPFEFSGSVVSGNILRNRRSYGAVTWLEREKKKARVEAEKIEKIKERVLPEGWKNRYAEDEKVLKTHAGNSSDGLVMSLSSLGRVDIEYISSITGRTVNEVIDDLSGSIYQDPETWEECFYKGWETADEYLSGNLSMKLKAAEEADRKYNGYFDRNVQALKKNMKRSPGADEIYVALGSPWVPSDVIDSFIQYLLGPNYYSRTVAGRVRHDLLTGTWEIPEKTRYTGNALSYTKYGTYRMEALHIIERTLNMKPVAVKDVEDDFTNNSGVRYVLNKAETVLALEKQEIIKREFRQWIWSDEKRKARLEKIYSEKYGSIKKRVYDGTFLRFPGMNPEIEIYQYQKDAIARILLSKNTLLAHDVGSGKTYIMVAAAMELKRIGLSKKNMIVVPNNIVGQWKNIFLSLYPNARLLCIEPKLFTPAKRRAVLEDIRDNDYDAIIMAYSCFDLIPMSKDWYFYKLEEEKRKIRKLDRVEYITHGIRTLSKQINKEYTELMKREERKKASLYFDELGVTRLFVDEAHNYKNVPVDTKIENIRGIKSTGSAKCALMMDKVHYIQTKNGGGGVVMATGTPITNSLTDAYVMQKYLQPDELEALDLQSFDSWIGMFAEKTTDFEIDVDTSNYRLSTRFTRFHNLPELTALLSSVSDFHIMHNSEDLPEFKGYNDIVIGKSPALAAYLFEISERADKIRQGIVKRYDDNMLKITTDGRKAALDVRLVMEDELFNDKLKVARCADVVCDIYKKTESFKGTQLIFCDISVPKQAFNIYDEMKRLLKEKGIPEKEIAYIYDAETDAEREKLFDKMRKGIIRILLGSTLKLGLGVNVQDKLFALHHLDVPWRPADMVQREGRIIRQGNTNKEVFIYRYITSGSFDAYSWQLLETKQQFITSLLSGSLNQRSGSDVDDTVLNYAEVKALAVGNPLIKKRVILINEYNRLSNLRKKHGDMSAAMSQELADLPGLIKEQRTLLNNCKKDLEVYNTSFKDYSQEERRSIRNTIAEGLENNELSETERKIAEYCGFDVVLPSNMVKEKPFVWLRKNGSYFVEMGEKDRGILVRLDNFFESLNDRRKRLQKKTDDLLLRKRRLTEELSEKRDYTAEIENIKKQIIETDRELGLKR